MNTNNPPLTASKVVDLIVYDLTGNIPTWDGGEAFVKAFCHPSITPDLDAVEAYAAQKNEELVTKCDELEAKNKKLSAEVGALQSEMHVLKKRDNLRANEIGRLRKLHGCKPSEEVRKTLSQSDSYSLSRDDVHGLMMRHGGLELLIPDSVKIRDGGSEPLNYIRKCRLLDLMAAHAAHAVEDITDWQPIGSFPKTGEQVEMRFKNGVIVLAQWMFSPNCGRYDICGFARHSGIPLPFNEPATHWRKIRVPQN